MFQKGKKKEFNKFYSKKEKEKKKERWKQKQKNCGGGGGGGEIRYLSYCLWNVTQQCPVILRQKWL